MVSVQKREEATVLRAPSAEPKKTQPVNVFAFLGILFAAAFVYTFAAWLLSGPTRTPDGVDKVPQFMKTWAIIWQIACPISLLWIINRFIVRPWRRERRLTLDGMVVIACLSCFWQDPLANYFKIWFAYNTTYLQWGSWLDVWPGHQLPDASNFAEPVLAGWSVYPAYFMGGIFVGRWVMNKAKELKPDIGIIGKLFAAFVSLSILDLAVEATFLRTGFWGYPAAFGPTLFKGHYYQLPLIEPFVWGISWTMMAALYLRNDKGESLAERGIEKVVTTPRRKTMRRLLAVVAWMNLAQLIYAPVIWMLSLNTGAWSAEHLQRSYMRDDLCGEGTPRACPDPSLPIFTNGSSYVTPDGRFVVPEGKQLPDQTR